MSKTSTPLSKRDLFLDRLFKNQTPLFGGQQPSQILQRAHDLLADGTKWTQRAMALNAQGHPAKPNDADAILWSLDGAVVRCCNTLGIAPPWLLYYLDFAVESFCRTRKLMKVTVDTLPSALSYFADAAHHDAQLEFLRETIVRLQLEGK